MESKYVAVFEKRLPSIEVAHVWLTGDPAP